MEHPYGFDPAYEEAGSWDVLDAEEQQDWLYPAVQDFAYVGGKPAVGPWSGAYPVTTGPSCIQQPYELVPVRGECEESVINVRFYVIRLTWKCFNLRLANQVPTISNAILLPLDHGLSKCDKPRPTKRDASKSAKPKRDPSKGRGRSGSKPPRGGQTAATTPEEGGLRRGHRFH
eukprot:4015737-Amphidinium_carterae.2